MKAFLALFAVIVTVALVARWETARNAGAPPGPAAAMGELAKEFPTVNHWGEIAQQYTNIRSNVRETDSVENPVVGELLFTVVGGIDERMLFHWEGAKLMYAGTGSAELGNAWDEVRDPNGWMGGVEMRPFLAKHGVILTPATSGVAAQPPPPPALESSTPGPVPVARIPSPQDILNAKAARARQQAAEIARKYGE